MLCKHKAQHKLEWWLLSLQDTWFVSELSCYFMVETKVRHSVLLVLSQSSCQCLWTKTYHHTHFILQQRKSGIKVILSRYRNQCIEGGFWSNYYNHPKTLRHSRTWLKSYFKRLFLSLLHASTLSQPHAREHALRVLVQHTSWINL